MTALFFPNIVRERPRPRVRKLTRARRKEAARPRDHRHRFHYRLTTDNEDWLRSWKKRGCKTVDGVSLYHHPNDAKLRP